MKKVSTKTALILQVICCVIWSTLALVRFVNGLNAAWAYAICAVAFLISSIRGYFQYRKEKSEQ